MATAAAASTTEPATPPGVSTGPAPALRRAKVGTGAGGAITPTSNAQAANAAAIALLDSKTSYIPVTPPVHRTAVRLSTATTPPQSSASAPPSTPSTPPTTVGASINQTPAPAEPTTTVAAPAPAAVVITASTPSATPAAPVAVAAPPPAPAATTTPSAPAHAGNSDVEEELRNVLPRSTDELIVAANSASVAGLDSAAPPAPTATVAAAAAAAVMAAVMTTAPPAVSGLVPTPATLATPPAEEALLPSPLPIAPISIKGADPMTSPTTPTPTTTVAAAAAAVVDTPPVAIATREEALNKEVAFLKHNNTSLESQLDVERDAVLTLKGRLSELQKEEAILRQALEGQTARISVLTEANTTAATKLKAKQEALDAVIDERDTAQGDLTRLEEQYDKSHASHIQVKRGLERDQLLLRGRLAAAIRGQEEQASAISQLEQETRAHRNNLGNYLFISTLALLVIAALSVLYVRGFIPRHYFLGAMAGAAVAMLQLTLCAKPFVFDTPKALR